MKITKYILFGIVSLFVPALIIYQFFELKELNKSTAQPNLDYEKALVHKLESIELEISNLNQKVVSLEHRLNLNTNYTIDVEGLDQSPQKTEINQTTIEPYVSYSVINVHFAQLEKMFEDSAIFNGERLRNTILKSDSTSQENVLPCFLDSREPYCRELLILRNRYVILRQSINAISKDSIAYGSDFSFLLEEVRDLIKDSQYYYRLIKGEL